MTHYPPVESEDSGTIRSGVLNVGSAILDWGNDDQEDNFTTRWSFLVDTMSRIPFSYNVHPYCDFSEHLYDSLYLDPERFRVTGGDEWLR